MISDQPILRHMILTSLPTLAPNGIAPETADELAIAFLRDSPRKGPLNGTLVELPYRFNGEIRSQGAPLHAVVIGDRTMLQLSNSSEGETYAKQLRFFSRNSYHQISCGAKGGCLIYVHGKGRYEFISEQEICRRLFILENRSYKKRITI